MAVEGRCRPGECITADTGKTEHGRPGRTARHHVCGGCPCRFTVNDEQFPQWDVVETKNNLLESFFEKIVVRIK